MRSIAVVLALGLFVLVVSSGVATADEPPKKEGDASAMAAAFEALKLRMEARMMEAELLANAGRVDDALAAYKSVGALYDKEVERIQSLFVRPEPRVADGPSPVRMRPGISPAPTRRMSPPSGWAPNRRLKAAEDAIMDGLRWLKAHQSPNGSWEAAAFGRWCDGKANTAAVQADGPGKASYTVGTTGLALLSFLSAGYTDRGKHPFADTIKNGLRYLATVQDPEGCFGARSGPNYVYNHAMAALAVVECYGLTSSPLLRSTAQRGLEFSMMSRNPYFGWRYGVKPGDNDTSVTHWMLLGIHAADGQNQRAVEQGRPAPFVLDDSAYDGARAWIEKMTDPDYGRVGYITRGSGPARSKDMLDRFPADKSEAMTAAGVHIRLMTGEDPRRSAIIRKGAELMANLPPVWNMDDGSIDMYYWYLGSLALSRVGGTAWTRWRSGLVDAVIPAQRADSDYCGFKGSWDPVGPWGPDGGRVYSTSLMILSLSAWRSVETPRGR